jgi:chemotaxis protein CheC
MLTGEEIGEMERSAIMEVGNIITGAYLNALSMMTNMKIFPTPPQLSIDMASAILSVPATYFGMNGDQILLIQTKFFDEAEIDGYFILIPDLESYGKILSSLGISMEV